MDKAKMTVLEYMPHEHAHRVIDETGKKFIVDLLVEGNLGGVDPKSLVGKTFAIEYMFAYCYIAVGCEEVHDEPIPGGRFGYGDYL